MPTNLKLLFDQNLPPRLVDALEDLFPGSAHVSALNLGSASDRAIWNHAQREGFSIVSKDSDFAAMSLLLGAPPRVIWVARGNCSAAEVVNLLRTAAPKIREFADEAGETYLVLT